MSIIIKGMEMPTNCWLCQLSVLLEKPREMLFCRIIKEEVLRNKVDGNCPIVEVPTPHGDLIDRETAKKTVRRALEVNCKRLMNTAVPMLIDYNLDDAPTIIEAEGGE